jgi:flagellar protein FliO/FliZ
MLSDAAYFGFLGGAEGQLWGMFWSMIRFFAATLFVAILAYYATKKLAGARSGLGRKGGNLSLIESINIGGQAVVQLVKVGDKFLVVGVTKERVTLLGEVDKEQVVEIEAPVYNPMNTPFGKILSRFTEKNKTEDDEGDE